MAKAGARRGEVITRSEDIDPPSAWTDDADCYYLWIDLPDFTREEVSLKIDDSNNINVSGERLTQDKAKYLRFDKTFDVPSNAETSKITGKFDGEILCVTIPKLSLNGDGVSISRDLLQNPRRIKESERFGRMSETLKRNMQIIFTAIVAFLIGVIVSRSITPLADSTP